MTVIKVWAHVFSALRLALTVILLIIFASLTICHLHVAVTHLGVLKLLSLTHIRDRCDRWLMAFGSDRGSRWLSPRWADTPLVLIHIVQTVFVIENSRRILGSVHSGVRRGCLRATRPCVLGISHDDPVWIDLIFHLLRVIVVLVDNFTGSFVI